MRKLAALLAGILVIMIALDTLLWVVDPFGVVEYAWQRTRLARVQVPHESGYRYQEGTHDIGYTLTIANNGLRATPSTFDTDCKIAFIGDSVTFGMGVDDDYIFVNLLANRIDVQFINAGVPGYNIGNIVRQYQSIDADGYIYLVIDNDALPDATYRATVHNPPSATQLYLDYLFVQPQALDIPRYRDFVRILDTSDVLTITYPTNRLTPTLEGIMHNLVQVDRYTSQIAVGDPHPDRAGHQQLADAIYPFVIDFVNGVCNA